MEKKTLQSTPPFTVEAELSGVSTRKDGGLGIRFTSQELGVEEKLQIMEYADKFGWLLFSPSKFTEQDIPDEQPEQEGKSQAKRLRSVLYVLWEQKSEEPDFDNYYKRQMNKIIDKIKGQLDEKE